jgi:hypothetical protein
VLANKLLSSEDENFIKGAFYTRKTELRMYDVFEIKIAFVLLFVLKEDKNALLSLALVGYWGDDYTNGII